MGKLYVSAVAPVSLKMTITPGDSGLDLTTPTAVVFRALPPNNGAEVAWTGTLSGATVASVTASHTFVLADLPIAGVYLVFAELTVPTGVVRTETQQVIVSGRFG